MYFFESSDFLFFENYIDFPSSINETSIIIENDQNYEQGYGSHLRPIFVVLLYSKTLFDRIADKIVKGQNYWHAAISFDPTLNIFYSFNFNFGRDNTNKFKGGLSFESIKNYKEFCPTGNMELNCFFINEEKYNQLVENFNFYINNKEKTRYSFINLFFSLIGKKTKEGLKLNQVCSTFVDSLLKSIDINVTNKPTNLVKPDDLMKKNMLRKQFIVYKGKIADFDEAIVIRRINKLIKNIKNDYFY